MNSSATIFHRALCSLLIEIFEGPPGNEAYLLNPGDPGLLRQLESIDASAASAQPTPGRTTIAAHVDHVHYGLALLNRWAAGEENPWAGADWNLSWQHTAAWDDVGAAGALSSAAHTAYHLGAIRQILAATGSG